MWLIKLIVLSLLLQTVYADMPTIELEMSLNNRVARDTAYNYIVSKSSSFVFLIQQRIEREDVVISSAGIALYNIKIVSMLPLSKESIRIEITNVLTDFIINNNSKIISGYTCVYLNGNDNVPGQCVPRKVINLWSK